MPVAELPTVGGSYILALHNRRPQKTAVGALGQLELEAGYYLYTGSAFGPGGLRARLGRHLRGDGKTRWHIDYLRKVAEPAGAWFCTDLQRREHEFATALAAMDGLASPFAGFGSSDCNCESHLYFALGLPELPRAGSIHLQQVDYQP